METLSSASATTASNVQLIQQGYADFAAGNIEALIERCTEDVVWGSYKNPDVPNSGMFYGKAGVGEFFTILSSHITYSEFEPKEFIAAGVHVIVLGHQKATVNTTGKTIDHDWCMSFKLREGKIEQFFVFGDTRDQSIAFTE